VHPDRPDYILIEFIDQRIDISKAQEKKIEGLISRKICGGCKFMSNVCGLSQPSDGRLLQGF